MADRAVENRRASADRPPRTRDRALLRAAVVDAAAGFGLAREPWVRQWTA